MSLLDQASSDFQAILTDEEGFGTRMTLTRPDSVTQEVTGFAADIGQEIDPETGVAVSGRTIHASLPLGDLAAIGRPHGVGDSTSRPWLVTMRLPSASGPETFKVVRTMPDRVGILVCILELYEA